MLSAIGSPLVAGSAESTVNELKDYRVERGFYPFANQPPVKAGEVIQLPRNVAVGFIAAGKLSEYQKPAPAVVPSVDPDPVPAPATKGRKSHARK